MIKRKFRGKRIDNNEWITGDLLHIAGGCLIYFGSHEEADDLDSGKDDVCVELLMSECAPVYPESVGMFTGLCDSSGEEIWEGQRIKDSSGNEYKVCFVKGKFVIKLNNEN